MTLCLYIASPSFSGSTLLTMLLAQHPGIGTIGELKGRQEDPTTYSCSCGRLFAECGFWSELRSALAAQGFRYDLGDRRSLPAFRAMSSPLADAILRRRYGSPWFEATRDTLIALWPWLRREVRRLLEYNLLFIDQVLRMTGGSVFVDSSKDPLRIKYLARGRGLELRVVQLVRDGRAVLNSARKNQGLPAETAAAEWRDTHLAIEEVARACCQGRLLRVRYEDLCREPDRELRRLFEFVSLPADVKVDAVDGSRLHVLGNRMRLRGRQGIRLDDRWRDELSSGDRLAFDRVAGALNRRFGYGDQGG